MSPAACLIVKSATVSGLPRMAVNVTDVDRNNDREKS
jgi:hypothetical protein